MDFLYVYVFFVVIVLFHELGHVIAAKVTKHKINRIHIGLGPKLLTVKNLDIHLLPIYGYVDIHPREGFSMPSFGVLISGSLSNLFLAMVCSIFAFYTGVKVLKPYVVFNQSKEKVLEISGQKIHSQSDAYRRLMNDFILDKNSYLKTINREMNIKWPRSDLNHPEDFKLMLPFEFYQKNYPCVVHQIDPSSPAYLIGLKKGDTIIQINGALVKHCNDILQWVHQNPNKEISLKTLESDFRFNLSYELDFPLRWVGYSGMKIKTPKQDQELFQRIQLTGYSLLMVSFNEIMMSLKSLLLSMYALLLGKIKLSILLSPLSIMSIPLMLLQKDLIGNFFLYFSKLNVAFFIINLLPIPGLDGGLIILRLVERITGRRLNPALINLINQLCLIVFVIIFFHMVINDSLRYLNE